VTRGEYSKIYEETEKRTQENMAICKRRQQIVEHPFGIVKFTMHGNHFLLRSLRKVRAEVALLFLGYNMKRVREILGFEGLMKRLDALIATLLLLPPSRHVILRAPPEGSFPANHKKYQKQDPSGRALRMTHGRSLAYYSIETLYNETFLLLLAGIIMD
jgi:hypothetical protein